MHWNKGRLPHSLFLSPLALSLLLFFRFVFLTLLLLLLVTPAMLALASRILGRADDRSGGAALAIRDGETKIG